MQQQIKSASLVKMLSTTSNIIMVDLDLAKCICLVAYIRSKQRARYKSSHHWKTWRGTHLRFVSIGYADSTQRLGQLFAMRGLLANTTTLLCHNKQVYLQLYRVGFIYTVHTSIYNARQYKCDETWYANWYATWYIQRVYISLVIRFLHI